MSSEDEQDQTLPKHFEQLNHEDQIEYKKLKESLNNGRNKRGKRLEAFADMLSAVKLYAVKGDQNDWKRCLVCGVCWIDNGIAINTRQLRLLIDKCKSSINGSLHRMGYNPTTATGDVNNSLVEKIPILKGNFPELRQWTVRQQAAATPQPKLPTPITSNRPQQFMSPAANVPSDHDMFEPLPVSQSYDFNPQNDVYIFNDPYCIPMNDWTEDQNNYAPDDFCEYDQYNPDL